MLLSIILTAGLGRTAPPDTLGTAEVLAYRRRADITAATPVQRLDSAALQRQGITDIGDALRRLSGVNLRDYGGAGGLKTVSVRGLGAAHTAVSYDGLSVTDTRQGQTDLSQFSTDRLASITLQSMGAEELLSPVRNQAMALVSFDTPWSTASDRRLHGRIALRQASFSTYAPSLSLQQNVAERTAVRMDADYFFALNDYPFTVENGVATAHLNRTNSRMQTACTEVALRQALGQEGQLAVKGHFYHNYRLLPGMVRYYVNENDEHLLEQTAFGQALWKQHLGRWWLMAATKYNWHTSQYADINAQYPGGALRQHYWQREAYATAAATYAATPWLDAAYAVDYAFDSQNSNQATDSRVSRDTWLQSLTARVHTERLTLLLRGIGHRYWNQQRGGASARDARRITPTASLSWLLLRSPMWLYLRAGYKESFRMPTFTESYYYHLGSKTLRPELTRQLSAGITMQCAPAPWWKMAALTADAYLNRVTDRIVSIPYNLFIWQTTNMGRVRSAGVDLTLHSEWMPAARHILHLSANYSWQQSRDCTSANLSTWHRQLAYTPRHGGAASLSWENPWVSVVVHTTFASLRWCTSSHLPTTSLPAYSEWGMTLRRSISISPRLQADLRADLLNAFDKRYEVIGLYPMPGRSYKLTAAMKF